MMLLFPGGGGPLLTLLCATLPLMVGVQVGALFARGVRRRRGFASTRMLAKALNLHPLTVSATIQITAQNPPKLIVVRELCEGEVNSLADLIKDGRIRTVEQTYTLESGQ